MRRAVLIAALLLWPARAQQAEHDWLAERLNKFAEAYNAWAAERAAGKLNLKGARELSKLWRAVERTEGWPRE